MLIGSSGAFDTAIPAEECGRRLNADRSAMSYVGHADGAGFELSVYGRNAIRVRGRFTPLAVGSRVSYRIELIPWMLWALAASYAVGIPIFAMLVNRGLLPSSVLIWLVLLTAIGLSINAWFSERQAQRLQDYVTRIFVPATRTGDAARRDGVIS